MGTGPLLAASAGAALASAGPWAYVLLFAMSAGESSAFVGLAGPLRSVGLWVGAVVIAGLIALVVARRRRSRPNRLDDDAVAVPGAALESGSAPFVDGPTPADERR